MTSLTEFILARIAEDEAAARAEDERKTAWFKEFGGRAAVAFTEWDAGPGDPARTLAQCAALRRIVAACGPVVAYESYEGPDYYGGTEACELTLRALASIWADHESYDPAWRLN